MPSLKEIKYNIEKLEEEIDAASEDKSERLRLMHIQTTWIKLFSEENRKPTS
jgi:hypothetical protein